ncbi:MAG: PEP-CTERM sorting domain-containing protein [Akkermansiaceae bacterium]
MMKLNLLLTAATISAVGLAASQAATIVTNNTGHANSSIMVLDNSDIGVTNNVSGTNGTDGDTIAYGNDGLWSDAGDVTYSYTGLAAGTYNVYLTWYSNGDTSATGVMANGVNLGAIPLTPGPDTTNGFEAYDEVNDLATEFEPFQLVGTATVTGAGTLDVVLTPQGANGFGRYDAVAISSVPEPSSAALLGLGGLTLILRRRK